MFLMEESADKGGAKGGADVEGGAEGFFETLLVESQGVFRF